MDIWFSRALSFLSNDGDFPDSSAWSFLATAVIGEAKDIFPDIVIVSVEDDMLVNGVSFSR